jgi:hypothetical protein
MAIIALGWRERANKKGVTGRVTGVLTLGLELRSGPLMYPWEIPVGGITYNVMPLGTGPQPSRSPRDRASDETVGIIDIPVVPSRDKVRNWRSDHAQTSGLNASTTGR